jgi:peptidoglycan/xylan/chitin deacetylase (PgdA/CDA1 family)
VTLTFDDGPSPYTAAILAQLVRAGVPATFFVVGQRALAMPEIVRREAASGYPVEDHTWDHARLPNLPTPAIAFEIARGQAVIASLAGAPTCFRPPYGALDERVLSSARARGLSTVMWTVDPRDWSRPGAAVIAERVLTAVRPGAVVLLHDGGGDRSQTVAALAVIVAALRQRGYGFRSICGNGPTVPV